MEPLSSTSASKYHGMLQAVNCIVKEEGVKALWKGYIPAQVLSVLYGVAQVCMFLVSYILCVVADITN